MNKFSLAFLLGFAANAWMSGLAAAPAGASRPAGDNPFDAFLAPTKKGSTQPVFPRPDANEVDTCYESGWTKLQAGDPAGALVEFDRLIALRPSSSAALAARSYARELLKDYDGATDDASRIIELDPGNPASYQRRAVVEMLARRWEEASKDLRTACEKPGPKNPYSFLFLWLVRARLGEQSAADEGLAAYLDAPSELDTPGVWVQHIGRFLLDREAEADFLAAASTEPAAARPTRELWPLLGKPILDSSKTAPVASGQRCEAWFYCGARRLLAGDKAGAADHFRRCLATKQTSFTEYRLAAAELEASAR